MFDNNIGQGPRTTGGRHLSKLPGSVQIEMAAIAIIAAAGAVKVTGTWSEERERGARNVFATRLGPLAIYNWISAAGHSLLYVYVCLNSYAVTRILVMHHSRLQSVIFVKFSTVFCFSFSAILFFFLFFSTAAHLFVMTLDLWTMPERGLPTPLPGWAMSSAPRQYCKSFPNYLVALYSYCVYVCVCVCIHIFGAFAVQGEQSAGGGVRHVIAL